jgi:hypothetical protein
VPDNFFFGKRLLSLLGAQRAIGQQDDIVKAGAFPMSTGQRIEATAI